MTWTIDRRDERTWIRLAPFDGDDAAVRAHLEQLADRFGAARATRPGEEMQARAARPWSPGRDGIRKAYFARRRDVPDAG